MDPSDIAVNPGLQSVLVLLASSVLAVAACRSLRLPPMIGYLVTGLALGPHALGVVAQREETHRLAEFGVVFLMFSIGLEFSLTKLKSMRRLVFGLGFAQVAATIALALGAAAAVRRAVAGRARARRHRRHVLDRDRVEAARRARRARQRARPRGDRGALVPGPRVRAAGGADPAARAARRRDRRRRGARARQGGGGAVPRDRRRAAADARLAARGGAPARERALRAERAADHAARGLHHRRGGPVACARRVPRRHADLRDRVPLPGRAGHPAVPRRAARAVLHHGRHDARLAPGDRAVLAGVAVLGFADDRERRPHCGTVQSVRRFHRHGAARRAGARAGRRVRLRAAAARRHRRHRARGAAAADARRDDRVDARHAVRDRGERPASCCACRARSGCSARSRCTASRCSRSRPSATW